MRGRLYYIARGSLAGLWYTEKTGGLPFQDSLLAPCVSDRDAPCRDLSKQVSSAEEPDP